MAHARRVLLSPNATLLRTLSTNSIGKNFLELKAGFAFPGSASAVRDSSDMVEHLQTCSVSVSTVRCKLNSLTAKHGGGRDDDFLDASRKVCSSGYYWRLSRVAPSHGNSASLRQRRLVLVKATPAQLWVNQCPTSFSSRLHRYILSRQSLCLQHLDLRHSRPQGLQ